MIRGIYTSTTGVIAQQTAIDNTSNNLANLDTTGFKRGVTAFQDLIYQGQTPGSGILTGQSVPAGLQIGSGVRVASITKIFTQGALELTGNQLDLAIQGEGFFQVSLSDGSLAYTRDGNFTLNASGVIVNADGLPLSPQVTIPSGTTSIAISPDGTVTANSGSTSTVVGNITLARFTNPQGLNAIGSNLFQASPASGAPSTGTPGQNGFGVINQGFLENSNVDAATELVDLVIAQRALEVNQRGIVVTDEMLQTTRDIVPG